MMVHFTLVIHPLLVVCLSAVTCSAAREMNHYQGWRESLSKVLEDFCQHYNLIVYLVNVLVIVLVLAYGIDLIYRKNQADDQTSQTTSIKQTSSASAALSVEMENHDKTQCNSDVLITDLSTNAHSPSPDNDELNDSYLLMLLDCIRVIINQTASEQEARKTIHDLLSEECPKYFDNDKVIKQFLALNDLGELPQELQGRLNETEEKQTLSQEDVSDNQEQGHENVSTIGDEELISMISEMLLSNKTSDNGTPGSAFEESGTKPDHKPISSYVYESVRQRLEFNPDARKSNWDDDTDVYDSLDQLHFFSGSNDKDSNLLVDSSGSFCKEDLESDHSWPSLAIEDSAPLDDQSDLDMDAFFTAPRYVFKNTPSCLVTTSSCKSCKDLVLGQEEGQGSGRLGLSAHGSPIATARLSFSNVEGSISDVLSQLTPKKWSDKRRKTKVVRELWSSNSRTENSPFNKSFSISSLEDILSPDIPPTPSSLVFGSPQKSPHVLGIRLHKPSGVKDVFLSVVGHDKKTGRPRDIGDTWTLGTREEMELILHVDTDPHLRPTRKYYGRYSLAFNDKSDLDEHLSQQEDSQEDFGFSMLCSHEDSEEHETTNHDCIGSSAFFSHISHTNDPDSTESLRAQETRVSSNDPEEEKEFQTACNPDYCAFESKNEKRQKQEELKPEVEKTECKNHPDVETIHDSQIWTIEEDSRRIFAFGCLALTGYLMYRCLK